MEVEGTGRDLEAPAREVTGNEMKELLAGGLRLRGRDFSVEELEWILELVASSPGQHRSALSRMICERLGWVQPNGRLKDQACRAVLLHLHRAGYLTLPPPRQLRVLRRPTVLSERTAPRLPFPVEPREVRREHFTVVSGSPDRSLNALWNEFVERYHYLGRRLLVGPQMKYLVEVRGQPIACLGFGGAAWKVEARDRWIGWTPAQREKNLRYIINNVRFLILPWVQVKNLASRLLSLAVRRVPDDWERRYAYRPVLIETFVETARHRGTCYQAANWVCAGETKGRGKMDRYNLALLPRKVTYLYPLRADLRACLTAM